MKTRADTKISLRRSSRTTESSKSSPSTLQKPDTFTKSNDVDCKKEIQTDSKNIPESKDIDVKPEVKISPSLGRKRNDDVKVTKRNTVTPKTKRRFDVLDDRTPLKDEILFCSQQFDSQSGIGWKDSYGSSSGRYVRLNGGRHKNTDVSDIVMQLVVPEDERHNNEDSIGTPPMLGIWMDSGAAFNSVTDQPYNNTRANRRKAKAKMLNDSGSVMKMMEKLRLAMEKCNETSQREEEEKSLKNLSAVKSKECQQKTKEMNMSKDLFESSEPVLQTDKKETFSVKKWSDLQKSFNKSFQKLHQTDSDTSWSDDDLFKEDSFIIKATQNPSTVADRIQPSKRKSETDNSDEPAAKNFKLNPSNKVPNPRTVSTSHCTKTDGKVTDVKPKEDRKVLSPFRRHSSFDDSFNNSVNSGCKQTSVYTGRFGDKSKLRKINSFSGPVSTSTPAKPLPSVPEHKLIKNMSPVKEEANTNTPDNKVRLNQRNSNSNSYKKPGVNPPQSNMTRSQMNVQRANVTQPRTNIQKTNVVQSLTNMQKTNVAQSLTNMQKTNVGQSRTSVPRSNATQFQINNAKQSVCYKGSKLQQVNQKPVAVQLSKKTEKPPSLTSNIKTIVSPKSQFPTVQKNMSRNNASSNDKNNINARRRSSGIFDTSLSDDLLCQLAEPDDILESQVSPGDKTKAAEKTTCVTNSQVVGTKPVNSRATTENIQVGSNQNVQVKSDLGANQARNTCTSPKMQSPTSSSQVGKYRFKHKVMSTSKSGCNINKPSPLPAVIVTGNKCDTKNVEPEIVKKTESLKHDPVNEKDNLLNANSEDLFLSDEDDGLSEPQIIAMLETAELEATQSLNKDQVDGKESTSEEPVLISPIKCTPEMGTVSQKMDNDTEINSSQSPFKCTPEEIEKKKLIAIQKRKASGTPDNSKHSSVATHNQSPKVQNISPAKYSPSEIEKKRQEALQRKRQKSGTVTGSSSKSSPTDSSPFKCSPEEIERKKLAALAKRKLLVGPGNTSNTCKSGAGISESNTNTNVDSVNKNKNVLDEIERKKQAALKRRQDRLKATQMSSNTGQNRMVYNQTNG